MFVDLNDRLLYQQPQHKFQMCDSIRVVCRLRPLNKIEIEHQGEECVTHTDKQISLNVGGDDNKYSFAFDRVFGPNTQQVMIYKEVATPIIKSVISGFNGTIFAYGQTGGGKTWTMEVHMPKRRDQTIMILNSKGLFQSISESDENLEFVIKSSYVEIYNEKLFDLLDPSKSRLEIKEDRTKGVFIQNCTQISVSSSQQMLKTMDTGSKNRKVAFTGMNERSSRSHSLFIIHLYQKNTKKDSTKQSKLYFVDLAGSQKVGKTGVQGQQLEEAKNINKSLSALGNVINALTSQKKEHVPYRDSKLTRILQESLGGNSKTTLIINCSMCTYNDKETLSTLRFGYRAKSIKNKPKVNEEKSVKQLMILLQAANKTIAELKGQLKLPMTSSGVGFGQPQIAEEDERDAVIADLKSELECQKKDEQERNKEMENRIKQLLLQLSKEKEEKDIKQTKWAGVFSRLYDHLLKINKYVNRSYVDLDYCLNNILLQEKKQIEDLASTEMLTNTLKGLEQYKEFYKNQLEQVLNELINDEKFEDEEEFKTHYLTPDKRKNKIALSQPSLYTNSQKQLQELCKEDPTHLHTHNNDNISCIIQNSSMQPSFQENSSDKISQSSLTEFETILESIETKESHRILIEEMTASMRDLKKENEDLSKKVQKMMEERNLLAIKLEEKYEQKILELDERVHEYKNIMHQKDIQLTKNFQDIDKLKKTILDEKFISERLKKIIESNGNMKLMHDMEEKVRSLASERQKIFNELYRLRQQLDECQITIKEKDQHIESLKSVMKELNQASSPPSHYSPQEITKHYNCQVYGTETPNVVQTVKGGGHSNKKSSLRKKTQGMVPGRQESKDTKSYVPFFKSFFN